LQPNVDALFPGVQDWLARLESEGWLLRGQATFIEQGHPAFHSPYRGPNSFQPAAMQRNTLSVDLVVGRRLWEGAELILVPEMFRGFGLSNTLGIASFPNGEAFKIGSETPIGYFARAFVRQTIPLSGDLVIQDDDPMRFAGPLPRERITITAGKVSAYDFFDDNRYAHDPRSQFMNWAFVGATGFDMTGDARGFTNGLAIEWENGTWAARWGIFQVAKRANSLSLDPKILSGWAMLSEVDRYFEINGRPGAVRFLFGYTRSHQRFYHDLTAAIDDPALLPSPRYNPKYNFVVNGEQELTDDLGAFFRSGMNDARTQNWMYSEQDWNISGGLSLRGLRWGRSNDTVGLAANIAGLFTPHRRFLQAGGIGFQIGDGRLTYGTEKVVETYYDTQVAPGLNVAVGYQFIGNPAYNRDRGPVSVFSLRLRAAF
jgi:high affinity Mn2+ porin